MRNDFGTRPYNVRFPYSKGSKKQGYDDRLDESLGARRGAESTKTQLLKKYEEMDEASLLAWQRQQELEAKKQAYLRNFRQMYMSAQGGRVPAGYNTGGLSNLFRLKNR